MRTCTLCGLVQNPIFPWVTICELEQHHLCELTDHDVDRVVAGIRVTTDNLQLLGTKVKARKELLEILVRPWILIPLFSSNS